MFETLKQKLGFRRGQSEDDVGGDPALAESRATGGVGPGTGDAASTTGTGESEEFVGRVAGQDDGAERMTGAEARAWDGETGPDTPSHGGGQPDSRE